jgi:hypothetical protein
MRSPVHIQCLKYNPRFFILLHYNGHARLSREIHTSSTQSDTPQGGRSPRNTRRTHCISELGWNPEFLWAWSSPPGLFRGQFPPTTTWRSSCTPPGPRQLSPEGDSPTTKEILQLQPKWYFPSAPAQSHDPHLIAWSVTRCAI